MVSVVESRFVYFVGCGMWDGVVLNDKWLQIKAEKLDPRFHFLSLDRVPFVCRKKASESQPFHEQLEWGGDEWFGTEMCLQIMQAKQPTC